MIPLFLQNYWKSIALGAFIAIIFGVGWYKGYSHEKMRLDAFMSEIKRNKRISEIQNAEIVKQQKQITTNVTQEYSNAVNKLNAYYAGHPHIVSLCNSGSADAVSSKSQSPTGTGTAIEGATKDVTIDLSIASKEVEQCQALIKWELEQEEVK